MTKPSSGDSHHGKGDTHPHKADQTHHQEAKGGHDTHKDVYGTPPAAHKGKEAHKGHETHKGQESHKGHETHKDVHAAPTNIFKKITTEGAKLIHSGEKYVAKILAQKEKANEHVTKIPNADKLSPAERKAHKVEVYIAPNGDKSHFDKEGRLTEKRSEKTSTTVVARYDKSGKHPASFEVVNDRFFIPIVLDRGKAGKNNEIRIDQTNGTVTSKFHDTVKTTEAHGKVVEKTVKCERQTTSEGTSSLITKDLHGKRLSKEQTGPDQKKVFTIAYDYKKDARGHESAVVANQYGSDRQLKHQFVFAKHADVEKQDPATRLDRKVERTEGRTKENCELFALHKDSKHPVQKTETIVDYKLGKSFVSEQNLDGAKVLNESHASFDERGRGIEYKYKSAEQNIDLSYKFTQSGKAESVSGKSGALDPVTNKKDLLLMADASLARLAGSNGVGPMDHGELLQHRGINAPREGEKPSGTLVYLEGGKPVQRRVEDGIVYDGKNKIGVARDNGEVTIGGANFNIITDKERAAAFTGLGTDGRYLDLTAGASKDAGARSEGFTGYLAKGNERILAVGGHLFTADQKFVGQLDAGGDLKVSADLEQKEKDGTRISQMFLGPATFYGHENGKKREFDTDRTSHGTVFLPSADGKGEPTACEVRLGMLIDKRTNEQLGKYIAPVDNGDGTFSGGKVIIGGKEMPLADMANVVFKTTVDGENVEMRGAVMGDTQRQADGTVRPGTGTMINLDTSLAGSKSNHDAKSAQYNKELLAGQSGAVGDDPESPSNMDPVARARMNNIQFDSAETARDLADKQYDSDKAAIDKMLATGQTDANSIYKIRKMGEHIRREDMTPEQRLKETIDKPGHNLEDVPARTKVDGRFLLPDLNNPGKVNAFSIDRSVVRDRAGDAVGNVDPSTGKMRLLDDRGRVISESLTDQSLRGGVLHFSYNTADGATKTCDWINAGNGKLLSADDLRKQTAQERAYAEMRGRDVGEGNLLDVAKRTKTLEARFNETLDSVVKNGVKDANKADCGFTTLEVLRGGPKEFVRAEHNKSGRHYNDGAIDVPALNSYEACQRTSGAMRAGNEHYVVDHGKIYRASFNGKPGSSEGQWVARPGDKPCGTLQPGYRANIDGNVVDLGNDPNFLFKMTDSAGGGERRIMGLGEPRRDASGKIIAGGLVDVDEVARKSELARKEIDQAANEYYGSESSLIPLNWAVDRGYFAGREEQLKGMQSASAATQELLGKQADRIFNDGFNSNKLATTDIDHTVHSMQSRLLEMNLTASDGRELSDHGQRIQAGSREALAMATTMALTGGTSALVARGSISVLQGVGGMALAGGTSSLIIRDTRGSSWQEKAANFGGGGLEGVIMYGGGNLGHMAKSFNTVGRSAEVMEALAKEQNLVKIGELASKDKKLFENLNELAQLQKIGKAAPAGTLSELAANPAAREMVSLIAGGKGHGVQAACEILSSPNGAAVLKSTLARGPIAVELLGKSAIVTNAFVQSAGFTGINVGKTGDLSTISPGHLIEGGGIMLAAEGLGALTHVPLGPRFEPAYKVRGRDLGKLVDTYITTQGDAVINNIAFSTLGARSQAAEMEKQNIALERNVDISQVTPGMYERYKNDSRINSFIYESAVEAAFTAVGTHPIGHTLTHFMGESLAAHPSKTAAAEEISLAPRISHDSEGEISRVGLPDGTVLDRGEGGWSSNNERPEFQGMHALRAEPNGDVVISRGDHSSLEIRGDGSTVERQTIAEGHKRESHTFPNGHVSTVETVDGKVAKITTDRPHSSENMPRVKEEIVARYGDDGALHTVEPFPGCEIVKEESGWSTYFNGELSEKNSYSKIDLLPDGTIRSERPSPEGGSPRVSMKRIDGTDIETVDGAITRIMDARGNYTHIKRDAHGEPVELTVAHGIKLTKEAEGWDIHVPGHPPEQYCKETFVTTDGTVIHLDEHGIVTANHIDGKRSVHVPGDNIEPVNYGSEHAAFEGNLATVADPMVAAHIREGVLDLHDRLRKTNKNADETMGQVLYEVNRLMTEPGIVDPARRLRWVDEALGLAAHPEWLSQGRNPTCLLAATEQREYHLHPETWFKMLRRINETGLVVGAGGGVLKSYVDHGEFSIDPDSGARSHYRRPGQTRVDGNRLEVSQIVQTVMGDAVSRQRDNSGLYYYSDIEPMHNFLTGRNEKFVVANARDPVDFAERLLAIKDRGDLYALVEMDANNLGPNGMHEPGGHVRVVKDISSPLSAADMTGSESLGRRFREDGIAVREVVGADGKKTYEIDPSRIEIAFGNTWDRGDSHQVLNGDAAFATTRFSGTEEHINNLVKRMESNPADPVERLELFSWKLGALNRDLDHKVNDIPGPRVEEMLQRLSRGEAITTAKLRTELDSIEGVMVARCLDREQLVHGDERTRLLALQIEELIDGRLSAKESGVNLPLKERECLASLGELRRAIDSVEAKENKFANRASLTAEEIAARAKEAEIHGPIRVSDDADRAVQFALRSSQEIEKKPVLSEDLQRKHEMQRLAHIEASGIDLTTAYKNHHGMMHYLKDVFAEADKTGERLHLIFVDIRKFKQANDVMGRDGADDALRYLTRHLAREIGLADNELMSRPGGDEIVVVLRGTRKPEEVKAIVERWENLRLLCIGDKELAADGADKKNTTPYGMKLISPGEAAKIEDNENQIVINLAIGAVTMKERRPDKNGVMPVKETEEHLANRGDALMNKIKNESDPEKKLAAFNPDFDVTAKSDQRHSGEPTQEELTAKYAPTIGAYEDLKAYSAKSETARSEERAAIEKRIDGLVRSEVNETFQILKLRESLKDMALIDGLKPEQVVKYLGNKELTLKRYQNSSPEQQLAYLERRQAATELWLNPMTDNPAREMSSRLLLREIQRVMTTKEGEPPKHLGVICADLNNMKIVNDRTGHDAGNVLLKHAGDYLRARLPGDCIIASPGGGGFQIFVPNEARRVQVEQILREYGSTPDRSDAKKGNPSSLFQPDLNVPIREKSPDYQHDDSKLRFGFSFGYAELDTSKFAQMPKGGRKFNTNSTSGTNNAIEQVGKQHDFKIALAGDMLRRANQSLDLDKGQQEKAGFRAARTEQKKLATVEEKQNKGSMEVEGFNEWKKILKERDRVLRPNLTVNPELPNHRFDGQTWQRPVDTRPGVEAYYRSLLKEQKQNQQIQEVSK